MGKTYAPWQHTQDKDAAIQDIYSSSVALGRAVDKINSLYSVIGHTYNGWKAMAARHVLRQARAELEEMQRGQKELSKKLRDIDFSKFTHLGE